MNYYNHHRSNSLLQANMIIRNNTLSPTCFNNYLRPKRENCSMLSIVKLDDDSIHFSNNNGSESESLKKKIFSPDEAEYQPTNEGYYAYDDIPLQHNRPLSSSISYSFQKTQLKKILVLDLDETLVHSSFNHFPTRADMELSLNFDGIYHRIYVLKRPYVNEFLKRMNELFDLYIFTASIPKYANPVLDRLDTHYVIKDRLYRRDCIERNGSFIKDLSIFRRSLSDLILLDNNPVSYSFNQSNGIPIQSWHDDRNDQELLKLIPLMEFLANVNDVRWVIDRIVSKHQVDYGIVNEIINRNNDYKNKKTKTINHNNNENNRYKGSSNEEDYIKIHKASTFTETIRKSNNDKQDLIKVNQKSFNRPCCSKCDTNHRRISTKSNLNDNSNTNNNNMTMSINLNHSNKNINKCRTIEEQQVKFISLNDYILERKALTTKKEKKAEDNTPDIFNRSANLSQLDLLSNFNPDKRSNSFIDSGFSFQRQKKKDNVSFTFLNTDNNRNSNNNNAIKSDLNAFDNKRRTYNRDNSLSRIYKKRETSLSYTNTPTKASNQINDTISIQKQQQLCQSPQRLQVNSYLNMNQSYNHGAINNKNRSTLHSMKKRLMLFRLKEEHKLAPINTFGRVFDDDTSSSLNMKKTKKPEKNKLFNSSFLPLQADSTLLIKNNSKRSIIAYNGNNNNSNNKRNSNNRNDVKSSLRVLNEKKKLFIPMK